MNNVDANQTPVFRLLPMHIPDVTKSRGNLFEDLANRKKVAGQTRYKSSGCK